MKDRLPGVIDMILSRKLPPGLPICKLQHIPVNIYRVIVRKCERVENCVGTIFWKELLLGVIDIKVPMNGMERYFAKHSSVRPALPSMGSLQSR